MTALAEAIAGDPGNWVALVSGRPNERRPTGPIPALVYATPYVDTPPWPLPQPPKIEPPDWADQVDEIE